MDINMKDFAEWSSKNPYSWAAQEYAIVDTIKGLDDVEALWKLDNSWQERDTRIHEGELIYLAYAITDIHDASLKTKPTDVVDLSFLPKPLELAEAMEKAARRIRGLTR